MCHVICVLRLPQCRRPLTRPMHSERDLATWTSAGHQMDGPEEGWSWQTALIPWSVPGAFCHAVEAPRRAGGNVPMLTSFSMWQTWSLVHQCFIDFCLHSRAVSLATEP